MYRSTMTFFGGRTKEIKTAKARGMVVEIVDIDATYYSLGDSFTQPLNFGACSVNLQLLHKRIGHSFISTIPSLARDDLVHGLEGKTSGDLGVYAD